MSTITVLSILHNLVTDATCIMLPDNGVEAYMLYGTKTTQEAIKIQR